MLRVGARAFIAALVLAGCAGGDAARSGTVSLESEPGAISAPFGAEGKVFEAGKTRSLAGPVSDAYLGALAPLVVPEPGGGGALVYQSRSGDGPALRVHRGAGGPDTLLADGALSAAWREGRLAYVRGAPVGKAGARRFVGRVVVRDGLDGRESRWTEAAGRYVAAAWAGRRLLVYRLRAGWPDLLVLDGPDRVRVLSPAGGLVAVSPDGRHAFLVSHGSSPPVVRVVEVATGAERARLELPDLRWVVESGSWSGDRVAAATSEGIALFRVREEAVELEQMLGFPADEFQLAGLEPRLDASGRLVTAWGSLVPRAREALGVAVVVECERLELRCVRSQPFPEAPGPRVVFNPSRP